MIVTTSMIQKALTAQLGTKVLPIHKIIEPIAPALSTFMCGTLNLTMVGMTYGVLVRCKYGTAK